MDGELAPKEAARIATLIEQNPEALALSEELRVVENALHLGEKPAILDDSRDFYWSQIERQIDAARALDRCGEVLEASRRRAHREIFHLRYGESQSIRAIAKKVGKTNEAVKVSLRRSRAALSDGIPELELVLDKVA